MKLSDNTVNWVWDIAKSRKLKEFMSHILFACLFLRVKMIMWSFLKNAEITLNLKALFLSIKSETNYLVSIHKKSCNKKQMPTVSLKIICLCYTLLYSKAVSCWNMLFTPAKLIIQSEVRPLKLCWSLIKKLMIWWRILQEQTRQKEQRKMKT